MLNLFRGIFCFLDKILNLWVQSKKTCYWEKMFFAFCVSIYKILKK